MTGSASDVNVDLPALLASGDPHVAIHNVRLVDVQPARGEHEGLLSRLVVEHAGVTTELFGAGRADNFLRPMVGRVGCLVPMTRVSAEDWKLPRGACNFHAYLEPSLRRVAELDYVERSGDRTSVLWGWRCGSQPHGFFAPAGLIPGLNGHYVPDETIEVTLRVPPEFVRACRRVQRSPAELLRGFVADAAGVHNELQRPRADGFSSNGSDERDYAAAWIDRAYGMWAIDVDAAEAADYERENRQAEREDFGALLDDFVDVGGKAKDLMTLVQAAVAKQRESAEGTS